MTLIETEINENATYLQFHILEASLQAIRDFLELKPNSKVPLLQCTLKQCGVTVVE